MTERRRAKKGWTVQDDNEGMPLWWPLCSLRVSLKGKSTKLMGRNSKNSKNKGRAESPQLFPDYRDHACGVRRFLDSSMAVRICVVLVGRVSSDSGACGDGMLKSGSNVCSRCNTSGSA